MLHWDRYNLGCGPTLRNLTSITIPTLQNASAAFYLYASYCCTYKLLVIFTFVALHRRAYLPSSPTDLHSSIYITTKLKCNGEMTLNTPVLVNHSKAVGRAIWWFCMKP
jgi:hypothetical protein